MREKTILLPIARLAQSEVRLLAMAKQPALTEPLRPVEIASPDTGAVSCGRLWPRLGQKTE
jgi:hypothetical protein